MIKDMLNYLNKLVKQGLHSLQICKDNEFIAYNLFF